MAKESLPVLPWTWTWHDINGRPMKPLALLLSRPFSYGYVIVIWALWLGYGPGPTHECIDLGERFGCVHGLWPEEVVSDPLKFLAGIVIAPWFHNSWEHILFVTLGFVMFMQSFEVRAGTVQAFVLFYTALALAAVIVAIAMNIGDGIWPDNAIIDQGMARNWMGGSAGFFGIIGASAHQSKSGRIVILLAIIFEVWNSVNNGTSHFTSAAHMVSLAYGYYVWGWWTGAWKNDS